MTVEKTYNEQQKSCMSSVSADIRERVNCWRDPFHFNALSGMGLCLFKAFESHDVPFLGTQNALSLVSALGKIDLSR